MSTGWGPRWTAVSLSWDNMDPPLGFDPSQLVHRVSRVARLTCKIPLFSPSGHVESLQGSEDTIQFGVPLSHLAVRFPGGIAPFNS